MVLMVKPPKKKMTNKDKLLFDNLLENTFGEPRIRLQEFINNLMDRFE